MAKKPSPLTPTQGLLSKLGSIAVHVEEMLSTTGHAFDRIALGQLLADAEVKEWLKAMASLAMLPVKR